MLALSPPPVKLRWVHRDDFAAVGQLTRSVSRLRRFERLLAQCVESPDTVGVVAEVRGQVVGFLAYRLIRELNEVQVRALIVRAGHRRRGIGRALLARAIAKVDQGYARVVMVVPDDKLRAHLFLKTLGFQSSAVLHGRFGDRDGYVFTRESGLSRPIYKGVASDLQSAWDGV